MAEPFPFTKAEIVASLEKLSTTGQAFWTAISPEQFVTKPETSWSPGQNVIHLNQSVRPVAKALKLPHWLLRLLFGKATAPSRHGEVLQEHYKELIKTRGPTGKFVPEPVRIETTAAAIQQKLITSLTNAVDCLAQAVGRWSETDLDRLRLPHPLLGKLTVREMLCFTIFHYQHHLENVRAKLG